MPSTDPNDLLHRTKRPILQRARRLLAALQQSRRLSVRQISYESQQQYLPLIVRQFNQRRMDNLGVGLQLHRCGWLIKVARILWIRRILQRRSRPSTQLAHRLVVSDSRQPRIEAICPTQLRQISPCQQERLSHHILCPVRISDQRSYLSSDPGKLKSIQPLERPLIARARTLNQINR